MRIFHNLRIDENFFGIYLPSLLCGFDFFHLVMCSSLFKSRPVSLNSSGSRSSTGARGGSVGVPIRAFRCLMVASLRLFKRFFLPADEKQEDQISDKD